MKFFEYLRSVNTVTLTLSCEDWRNLTQNLANWTRRSLYVDSDILVRPDTAASLFSMFSYLNEWKSHIHVFSLLACVFSVYVHSTSFCCVCHVCVGIRKKMAGELRYDGKVVIVTGALSFITMRSLVLHCRAPLVESLMDE